MAGTLSVVPQSASPDGLVLAYDAGPDVDIAQITIPLIIDACKNGPLKAALRRALAAGSVFQINNLLLASGALVITVLPDLGLANYRVQFDFDSPDFVLLIETSAAQTGRINLRFQHTITR